jgi:hypothetical protein
MELYTTSSEENAILVKTMAAIFAIVMITAFSVIKGIF